MTFPVYSRPSSLLTKELPPAPPYTDSPSGGLGVSVSETGLDYRPNRAIHGNSDAHHTVEPPLSPLLSPSSSPITSASSIRKTRSCITDLSLSLSNHSRRFYASNLGRPPGLCNSPRNNKTNRYSMPQPQPQQTASTPTHQKTAPMKELQKACVMITDLKKENFDLKLQLYHLEGLVEENLDKYQLEEENRKLWNELRERNEQVESLELALASLLAKKEEQKSVGTQTICVDVSLNSPPVSIKSYHTAFPVSPEAFGLSQRGVVVQRGEADMSIDHMVTAFQSVRIQSPAPVPREEDLQHRNHGRVRGWLSQIEQPLI
ncbi:uncharacterized protein BYT42DRAFT_613660 [Radiomyces spectabilis]|uniref:uncharacterized protein n=1 Tax=Radiomyces spectabilis TaxID=64574 RepID=UPI00221FBCEC|nr:uncharacterized protein BYT42DRAFT_613660 [Radiomyces spectabilis]KAI8379341.1 hypothetical protein BYT42DRAFT_613660 [Radiomyces spectabilis]